MNKPLTTEQMESPVPDDAEWNGETFKLTIELTQDEINELGEMIYNSAPDELYNKLVNAASEAGADLP